MATHIVPIAAYGHFRPRTFQTNVTLVLVQKCPNSLGRLNLLKCLCDEVSDYPVKIIMLVVIYCFANMHRIILLAGNIT